MPTLKENPTLPELQQYEKELCAERGWDKSTTLETWLLFTEEVGELAKAIRDTNSLYAEKKKDEKAIRQNLEGEFADVLSYILHLANDLNVDLEKAFRDKEAINVQRHWK